jgi:PEGA domain
MVPFADNPCTACRRVAAWRTLTLVLLAAALLLPAGCVRRRLNVRSNPPGAIVYVDNQQIGTTPCSVDFVYYGTREIRLVKPGYETLTVNQPIPAPWYQIPPIDFVAENLVPTKIRDNRSVSYDLAPQLVVPTEQLIDRGQQLRTESQQFPIMPAGAAMPAAVPVPPAALAPVPPGSFGPPPNPHLISPAPTTPIPFGPPSPP